MSLCEFKAILVHRVSSGRVKATQRNPVSKKPKIIIIKIRKKERNEMFFIIYSIPYGKIGPDVPQVFNHNSWEAEAGGSL